MVATNPIKAAAFLAITAQVVAVVFSEVEQTTTNLEACSETISQTTQLEDQAYSEEATIIKATLVIAEAFSEITTKTIKEVASLATIITNRTVYFQITTTQPIQAQVYFVISIIKIKLGVCLAATRLTQVVLVCLGIIIIVQILILVEAYLEIIIIIRIN